MYSRARYCVALRCNCVLCTSVCMGMQSIYNPSCNATYNPACNIYTTHIQPTHNPASATATPALQLIQYKQIGSRARHRCSYTQASRVTRWNRADVPSRVNQECLYAESCPLPRGALQHSTEIRRTDPETERIARVGIWTVYGWTNPKNKQPPNNGHPYCHAEP